jgi:transposase
MANNKRGGGRPTKFNRETADKIVALVRAGNYLETAALACGVSVSAVRHWMREARHLKTGAKREFLTAVREASAQAQIDDMRTITMSSSGDWRAAAWRLEHRWPQTYAKKTKHQVSGPKGGPVQVETRTADEMTDDELAAIAAKGA